MLIGGIDVPTTSYQCAADRTVIELTWICHWTIERADEERFPTGTFDRRTPSQVTAAWHQRINADKRSSVKNEARWARHKRTEEP